MSCGDSKVPTSRADLLACYTTALSSGLPQNVVASATGSRPCFALDQLTMSGQHHAPTCVRGLHWDFTRTRVWCKCDLSYAAWFVINGRGMILQ